MKKRRPDVTLDTVALEMGIFLEKSGFWEFPGVFRGGISGVFGVPLISGFFFWGVQPLNERSSRATPGDGDPKKRESLRILGGISRTIFSGFFWGGGDSRGFFGGDSRGFGVPLISGSPSPPDFWGAAAEEDELQ